MEFSQSQLERYSRHIILREIGPEGQEKLLNSKVLVVGAGGLGSPVLLYLAAAGVGTIGIIDFDNVDLTNLQRQVIHATSKVGQPKVTSARERIVELNPDVNVVVYHDTLTTDNAHGIIMDYDIVVEATDNFSSKFLVNDACVKAGKPFSQGGVIRFEGQTFTHVPGTACYRCLYNAPPPAGQEPSCSQAGILGSIAGMLGTIQATEVLKFITGTGGLLTNRLLMFDALAMNFRSLNVERDPDCAVCGGGSRDCVLEEEAGCCNV